MGRGPSREASHIGRFPRGGFELLAIVSCFLSTFGCSIAQFDLCGLRHRAGHNGRTAHTPSTLGTLAAHQMSATGPSSPELARTGDLDPLAQALVGLLFRHLCHPFIEKPSATLLGAPLCGGTFPYGKTQAREFTRSAATGQHLNRRSRQKIQDPSCGSFRSIRLIRGRTRRIRVLELLSHWPHWGLFCRNTLIRRRTI